MTNVPDRSPDQRCKLAAGEVVPAVLSDPAAMSDAPVLAAALCEGLGEITSGSLARGPSAPDRE